MRLALVFLLLTVAIVQAKKIASMGENLSMNLPNEFIKSQVFDKEGSLIFSGTINPKSKYQCQAFLLYNDTFVDIKHSEIDCNMTGSVSSISTGQTVIAKTGFIFRLGFNVNIVINIKKDGQFESTIFSADIVSKPDENVIDITSKLVNFTQIDELTDITEKEKEEIKSNLVKDVGAFTKHEQAAEEQRFKKRWVQSTEVSNKIGKNSRLKETLTISINNTRNTFQAPAPALAATRQVSNSLTVDGFLEEIRVNCENGVNVFHEGLIGANITCDPTANEDEYRRIDGLCNNLNSKHFGATGIPMRRLTTTAYADGMFAPRQSPVDPRTISNNLHSKTGGPNDGGSENIETTKGVTHMTMQFGQFLDHDITITPQAELDCCNSTFLALDQAQDSHLQRCLNIPVEDITFPETCSSGSCCHSFTRSDHICSNSTHREQFNALTAFVDGSNIYGSDQDTSQKLRTLVDGLMKTNPDFLIQNLPNRQHCGFSSPGSINPLDLVAGDVRAIVQPTLASMHTLFLNEHNRIAGELKSRLGSALASVDSADEFLFQETRKIIGAQLQNIVYKEYLPVVLGSSAMVANGLIFVDETNYDPGVDPSIFNEFATVAYRFGHSTVRDIINNWRLRSHFFNSAGTPDNFIVGNGGTNWMNEMKAAIQEPSPKNDLIIGDALRNHLFRPPHSLPEDLAARNIQRSREHGIPTYQGLRSVCGLSTLGNTAPPQEINQTSWDALLATFSSFENIEPFTGGLAENAPADGIVGPLFACIIGRQFQRLKDGDRYFYTHTSANNARGLGENTKQSVLTRTLGHIICDNTDAVSTQRNVFRENSTNNPFENCNDIEGLNFDCIVNDLIGNIFMNGTVSCNTATTKTTTSTSTTTTTSTITTTTSTTVTSSKTRSTTTTSSTTRSTTTTATSKTSPNPQTPAPPPIHQTPGKCMKKDITPVELDETWQDSCKDDEGNSYSEGSSLMSCCGCFRYDCTVSQIYPFPRVFNWTKELSPTCCQTCNGTVVSDGTVTGVEIMDDECGTVKTSSCKIRSRLDNNGINVSEQKADVRDEDAAVAKGAMHKAIKGAMNIAAAIEEEYYYGKCCVDETGLHPVKTNIPDPTTCSTRMCETSPNWAHAAWVSTQQFPGCGCCLVEGKMVADGFSWTVGRYPVETWECCRGKIVMVKDEKQLIFH